MGDDPLFYIQRMKLNILFSGIHAVLLPELYTLHQPCHVLTDGAHGLQTLDILFHLIGLLSEDLVPVCG